MTYPPVIVVDEQDRVIGSAMLAEAWERGLFYRNVMVIVEDGQGRFLLHKRGPEMRLYPGRWDAVGGHVDVTPDYLESARIELLEEAGIDDADLEKVAYLYCDELYDSSLISKRFVMIYRTQYDGPLASLHDEEVAEMHWFTRDEVVELAKNPEQISECLYRCLPFMLAEEGQPAEESNLAVGV